MYQDFLQTAAKILHKNRNGTTSFNRVDNNQDNFENRLSYNNKFDESDYNKGGFRNPNEYNTDNWDRNGYDRSFGGGGRGGVEEGSNWWEKPVFNDTINYDRERDHYEPANVKPIEVFELYESAPKYGKQHNLIFSVNLNILILHLCSAYP